MAELERHGNRERIERLERELDEARAQRDKATRKAVRAGLPQAEIARVLGISRQLVSLVLRDKP